MSCRVRMCHQTLKDMFYKIMDDVLEVNNHVVWSGVFDRQELTQKVKVVETRILR